MSIMLRGRDKLDCTNFGSTKSMDAWMLWLLLNYSLQSSLWSWRRLMRRLMNPTYMFPNLYASLADFRNSRSFIPGEEAWSQIQPVASHLISLRVVKLDSWDVEFLELLPAMTNLKSLILDSAWDECEGLLRAISSLL
mmetsp:Transcript_24517/g.61225  ORF Transcript_24517/g.61225 Transcript_24517/m.61225 type:complete len:138 (+) Transcript_24517:744-1157(+)